MTEESLLKSSAELFDDDDLFIKPVKKKKILMLSDHPIAPSGVGVQARVLIEGLIATGKYTFRCLGGAIKHQNYQTIKVNDDWFIKPTNGFGDKNTIRQLLMSERPDAILIFTDPRQFVWLWEMEDEIHQICPITYWHVWDNGPFPEFNRPWYEGTDLINCLSHKTFELVSPEFPEKTNYIPHAFPKTLYHPMSAEDIKDKSEKNFGDRADWFKMLWVNRNAHRKMPSDLLESWKLFLDDLEGREGHRKALLIMHTDPKDQEGPDLFAVMNMLGLQDNVWFSTDKIDFPHMNLLHNCVDGVINIAKNEGFGLSTLISMQVGKPIIALATGGQTRQVIDYRDGTTHGVAIEPIKRVLVGSQAVPYIYEDLAGTEDTRKAFMTLYDLTPEEKEDLAAKMIAYVDHEFKVEDMINKWDETLEDTIEKFQAAKSKQWTIEELDIKIDFPVDAGKISTERQPDLVSAVKPVAKPAAGGLKVTPLNRKQKRKIKHQMRKAKTLSSPSSTPANVGTPARRKAKIVEV